MARCRVMLTTVPLRRLDHDAMSMSMLTDALTDLVLANVRVLLGLVTTLPRRVGDDVAESM
jgi:hypothetical protein